MSPEINVKVGMHLVQIGLVLSEGKLVSAFKATILVRVLLDSIIREVNQFIIEVAIGERSRRCS